jgi:hypothetical protein
MRGTFRVEGSHSWQCARLTDMDLAGRIKMAGSAGKGGNSYDYLIKLMLIGDSG